MELDTEPHLSYDDILVKPQYSTVDSRSDVDTTSRITPEHNVDTPIVSAPMDTVTEAEMAQKISDAGGVGIIHRFYGDRGASEEQSIDQQAGDVQSVTGLVGAAVGIGGSYEKRASAVADAGADFLCLDVAHGHMERTLDAVEHLSNVFDIPIVAGNVATEQGTRDLISAGADTVKVGVGPGSHCLTRDVAGVGVPQASAVRSAVQARADMNAEDDVAIIADGGIQSSGDIVKATLLGADTAMIGGLFAGCKESPAPVVEQNGVKYKRTHGMASEEAREDHGLENDEAAEGASGLTRYQGAVSDVVGELSSGLRSGLSYSGGHTLDEARRNAELIRITSSTQVRNGTHGVYTNN